MLRQPQGTNDATIRIRLYIIDNAARGITFKGDYRSDTVGTEGAQRDRHKSRTDRLTRRRRDEVTSFPMDIVDVSRRDLVAADERLQRNRIDIDWLHGSGEPGQRLANDA